MGTSQHSEPHIPVSLAGGPPSERLERVPCPSLVRLTSSQWLLAAQSAYFSATGIWSLVSLHSFERITGPKTDDWLVKTVGALVTTIGGVLGMASRRRTPAPEVIVLATGSALGLAAIDTAYVVKRRIAPIYLLDAAAELILVGLWLGQWRARPLTSHQDSTSPWSEI